MNFHAVTKSLLKQTNPQRDLSRFAYQQDDSSSCEREQLQKFYHSGQGSFMGVWLKKDLAGFGNPRGSVGSYKNKFQNLHVTPDRSRRI